jgi:hypothetical protein
MKLFMFMHKIVQGMIFGNVSLEAKLVGPKNLRLLCVFEPSELKILQNRQTSQQVVFAISCVIDKIARGICTQTWASMQI